MTPENQETTNVEILSLLALAGFGALLSTPAMAQEMPEHGVFIMNSLLFLFGGVLVMFMACGFCMLEAGLVGKEHNHAAHQECGAVLDCSHWLLCHWL